MPRPVSSLRFLVYLISCIKIATKRGIGRDGAALAGALLEEMDRVHITGIFATHLHELFDLPLKTDTLSYKRMGIDWVSFWSLHPSLYTRSLFS